VLLRPAALSTGQNDPLFERPDLTQDDYYRLRHPSRLTAARRVTFGRFHTHVRPYNLAS
jgi:hypothetical protein